MREITPGSVRSTLSSETERLIDILGIDWVEPNKLYARAGYHFFLNCNAIYDSVNDFVTVNTIARYPDRAFLHEVIHWTGHATRLNRAGIRELRDCQSYEYCHEEGIAELGGYLLGKRLGIEIPGHERSMQEYLTAYCIFRNDVEAEAQQAVDFVMQKLNALFQEESLKAA